MLTNVSPLTEDLAWPVAVAIAWVVGELGQAMTKGSLVTESDTARLALVAPAMVQVRPGSATVLLTELPDTFARSSDPVPRPTEPH